MKMEETAFNYFLLVLIVGKKNLSYKYGSYFLFTGGTGCTAVESLSHRNNVMCCEIKQPI